MRSWSTQLENGCDLRVPLGGSLLNSIRHGVAILGVERMRRAMAEPQAKPGVHVLLVCRAVLHSGRAPRGVVFQDLLDARA